MSVRVRAATLETLAKTAARHRKLAANVALKDSYFRRCLATYSSTVLYH